MPKGEVDSEALQKEEPTDYVLNEKHNSVWVTVGNISVYIKRDDEGVSVDLYPRQGEDGDSLASCWALYADAEPDGDEP